MKDMIDIYVNGKKYTTVETRVALAQIVSFAIPILKYMSKDAIFNWILEACSLVEESLEKKKPAGMRARITKIRKYIQDNSEYMTREKAQQYLVNVILSNEGLGIVTSGGKR